MKDIIKNSSKIKGVTKIELFNKNGELEHTHEEENMFSPFWGRYLNNRYIGYSYGSIYNSSIVPIVTNMCIYNTEKTENEIISNVDFRDVGYVGYAHTYTTYTGSDKLVGNVNKINTDYCGFDMNTGKTSVKYVCDFNAGVGTGTFNTVSLGYTSKYIAINSKEAKSSNVETQLQYTSSSSINSMSYVKMIMKGDYIIIQKNLKTGCPFTVFNKKLELLRSVDAPATYYFTILDLEPNNDDVIYIAGIKSSSSSQIYKWTLSTDNIEFVKEWKYAIFGSVVYKKDGRDAIGLMYASSSSIGSKSSYYLYDFDFETMECTGSNSSTYVSSGYITEYQTTNINTVKKSDGDYGYLITRSGGVSYYDTFEDYINDSSGENFLKNSYIGACVGYYYNEADGCITSIHLHASPFTSYNVCVVTSSNPLMTVNKLEEPITKTEEQSMRITYTLEMDM